MIAQHIANLRRTFHKFMYDRAATFAVAHFDYPALDDIHAFHASTVSESEAKPLISLNAEDDPLITYHRFRARYSEDCDSWLVREHKFSIHKNEFEAGIPENAGHTQTHECETGYDALLKIQELQSDALYKTDGNIREIVEDTIPESSLHISIVDKIARGCEKNDGWRFDLQNKLLVPR